MPFFTALKLNKGACFQAIMFVFILFAVSLAYATDIIPSHAYQKTEVLRLTLQEQGGLDIPKYEAEEKNHALRHPRHVMQKVRECHIVLSKLLKNNGIEAKPLPKPFSVREIRPSDVQNGVDHLLQDALLGLDPDGALTAADLEPGKVPSDVYNNLKRICSSIRAEIVPSDVYRIARAVNENLDKIAALRGYDSDITFGGYQDKSPADVYQKTWDFLEDLRALALDPDFAILGGVIVPNEVPNKDIAPQDVIALMNDALAKTLAMKYTLGIREHVTLPEYEGDKTPSNVFTQIERAHRVVQFLLEKEAEE